MQYWLYYSIYSYLFLIKVLDFVFVFVLLKQNVLILELKGFYSFLLHRIYVILRDKGSHLKNKVLSGIKTKCLCCFIIFQIHTVIPYPYHLRLVCFHFFTTWHTMKLVGEMCQVIFHDNFMQ